MLEDWRMRAARRVPPIWAIAIAVVAVSTSAILIRWSRAPSIVAAFYRVLFTTLLLAPFLGTGDRAPLTSLGRGALLAAGATGVALALHFATWFESLRWTSVAASVTLVQTQPVFVAIGAALLLDERVGRRGAAGIVVALVGMAAMSLSGAGGATVSSPRPLYGNGLAIAGAVLMAAYVLAGRRLRQEIALLPYVLVVYAVCTVVLCLLALAQGVSLVAYPPREWLLFLGMAVGPGILGHTTINWALEHVESSVVSVSLLGEPIGSALLAVVLLAEVPGVGTVLGGTVVLAGIYVTVSARRD